MHRWTLTMDPPFSSLTKILDCYSLRGLTLPILLPLNNNPRLKR
jgi:hypothetical protein